MMTFFFDNNLSEKLAKGLKDFGENVTHLKDIFPDDTPDCDWLKYCGDKNLILITRDERVRFRPNEISAFKDHCVGAFFLGGKNRSRCELIQQVVRNWARIKDLAENTKRPFAYRVPPSGAKIVQIPLA